MTDTTYFWQGGRKIPIRQDAAAITIQAASEAEARAAAARAGVQLQAVQPAAANLVRADVVTNRDPSMDRLRALGNVVHHVYRHEQDADADSEYLITESFFLKFKEGTSEATVRDYLARENLLVERRIDDRTYLVRVTTATGRNPIRAANAAAEEPAVEYAEPNLVRRLQRFAFIPPDELFASQWHLHAPAAAGDLVAGAGVFAADAWDITRGSREIVVAVADDGFDLAHPDFQGAGKVVARLNATVHGDENNASITWDSDVRPRAGDYHGTPCLGVAVAEGNGSGVVGVAPGCALVAVRFPLGSMTDAHFIVMFEKISTLADIVSCSWGVPPADAPMSRTLSDAMARLASTGGRRGKGLVFCIAAGNNNAPVHDLGNTRTYRYLDRQFGFTVVRRYSGPIDRWVAAHPDAIIVSASTSLKTRSAYSSWGRQVSVCAPSNNFDDLDQVPVHGRGITTTDNEGVGPGSDFTAGSRFTSAFGGTSSATPTVAGVCGLVLSANPALTAAQVRDVLRASADKDMSLETETPVNEPGDFDAQGFSLWFGFGKVNAFRAVQAVAQAAREVRAIDVQQEPRLEIPDVGQSVFGAIDIEEEGVITDLRVQVDISHTYIGDLRVDLVSPQGTAVSLHANTGGDTDNLTRTYSTADKPAMRALMGHPIRGRWRLRVTDVFRLDSGRLNRWRIAAKVAMR